MSVLCLGAHSDDIEIGAGATLLSMQERGVRLDVHWCVLSGDGEREREARASASDFLAAAESSQIEVMSFRDGFFPEQGDAIKSWFTALKERVRSRPYPHSSQGGRASRPPARLPAHLEYFPGSLHSRVRNPKVGWRYGSTQPVCADFSPRHEAKNRSLDFAFRQPALESNGLTPRRFSGWLG